MNDKLQRDNEMITPEELFQKIGTLTILNDRKDMRIAQLMQELKKENANGTVTENN